MDKTRYPDTPDTVYENHQFPFSSPAQESGGARCKTVLPSYVNLVSCAENQTAKLVDIVTVRLLRLDCTNTTPYSALEPRPKPRFSDPSLNREPEQVSDRAESTSYHSETVDCG